MHKLMFTAASPELQAAVHDLIASEMARAISAGVVDAADMQAAVACLGTAGFGSASIASLADQAVAVAAHGGGCEREASLRRLQ